MQENLIENALKTKQKRKLKVEEIEARNIAEEIQEIIEKCIKCGMCKSLCPVFLTMREEYLSPRGRTILMLNKEFDEIFFKCNLCKACENKCPLKLKVWEAIRKAREVLNLKNKQLKGNKEMIKNVKETGNPFGKNPEKAGKLYCC